MESLILLIFFKEKKIHFHENIVGVCIVLLMMLNLVSKIIIKYYFVKVVSDQYFD